MPNKESRKIFIRLIQFAGLCVIVYFGLLWILNSIQLYNRPLIYRATEGVVMKGGDAYMSHQIFDPSKKHDILIFGSSHAYRGYDPRNFEEAGYTAFNLGSNSQAPCHSSIMLQDLIEKDNVSVVILDLVPALIVKSGFESGSTLVANVQDEGVAAKIALSMKDIRALNIWSLRLLNSGKEPIKPPRDYEYKGYAMRTDSVKGKIDYSQLLLNFTIDEDQAACFEDFMAFCNANDIALYMVQHPTPKEMDTDRHDKFHAWLAKRANRFEFTLIDHAFDHDMDTRDHYYDHTHFNASGVEIWNARLIEELESKGLREAIDRRTN